MLNYLQNGRCALILITSLAHTTTPAISTKNPFLYFSQFFLFTKSSIQSPLTLPFSIPQQFSPPQCCSQPSQKPEISSLPQSFIQFKLHHRYQGARESCDDQHCLDLSLLPQSMDSDNEVYDH